MITIFTTQKGINLYSDKVDTWLYGNLIKLCMPPSKSGPKFAQVMVLLKINPRGLSLRDVTIANN